VKNTLIAILIAVFSCAACSKKTSDEHASTDSDNTGKAIVDTALQLSAIDVSALSRITERIEGACARNKYGLSEEACIQTIEDRKDTCIQQTAHEFPGQLANTDRMQEVVASYVECLFQK
jgi:hypothetical protein